MEMFARSPFARDRAFAAGLIRRVLRDKRDAAFDAFRQTSALAQNNARAAQIYCVQHIVYLISRVLLPPVPHFVEPWLTRGRSPTAFCSIPLPVLRNIEEVGPFFARNKEKLGQNYPIYQ